MPTPTRANLELVRLGRIVSEIVILKFMLECQDKTEVIDAMFCMKGALRNYGAVLERSANSNGPAAVNTLQRVRSIQPSARLFNWTVWAGIGSSLTPAPQVLS